MPRHGPGWLLTSHAWRSHWQGDWARLEAHGAKGLQVTLASGEPGALHVLALRLCGHIYIRTLLAGSSRARELDVI